MPQHPTNDPATTAQSAVPATASPAASAKAATSSDSKIRLTAFLALVLIVAYLITGFGVFPIILLFDFSLRAFGAPQYSPLGVIAGQTARALRLPAKPVYMPPKRFAARVGFVFCAAVTILHYADQEVAATLTGAVLAIFAALESLAGFCAGCYVYNAWARLRA